MLSAIKTPLFERRKGLSNGGARISVLWPKKADATFLAAARLIGIQVNDPRCLIFICEKDAYAVGAGLAVNVATLLNDAAVKIRGTATQRRECPHFDYLADVVVFLMRNCYEELILNISRDKDVVVHKLTEFAMAVYERKLQQYSFLLHSMTHHLLNISRSVPQTLGFSASERGK